MAAIGLIVGLAVGFLIVAGAIYYFYFMRQDEELPTHTNYVQQVPMQPAPAPVVYSAPPPQPVYSAAPTYAAAPGYVPQQQVVYGQASAPGYGAPQGGGYGGPQGDSGGGGMSGASVAMGAAAGMAGGLLLGGLISEAGHSGGGGGGYDDDDGFAGDF